MRRFITNGSILIVILMCATLSTYAQNRALRKKPVAPGSGVRAELLSQVDEMEKKLVALAEAVPQEKYSWRPGEGVRSISEVYMHVADGSCRILRNANFEPPKILDDDYLEQITDKTKVIDLLKLSFQHVRQALKSTTEANMNKRTKLFGKETTYRNVFITVITHMHEHLGQSIAYARMNNIVPPWTAAQQQQKN